MRPTEISIRRSRPGLYIGDDGVVTFALYLPHKQRVELIGDFNNWERGADFLEGRPDGIWIIEKRLDPGEYRYQFAVDDVVIADPYARAVDYETDPPRAILEMGRNPYRWQNDGWNRPRFTDLVIYEMHVADFSPEGSLDGATRRLGHLQNLGVNAIELMPVTQGASEDYWGYEPAYFFAVENDYGTADDFRRFVDQAHGGGIAVILDLVLAHTAHEHPFARLYPMNLSPWYSEQGIGGENEFGFPTFDHRKPAARAFTRDIQDFWFREFHVDGIRYDYVKNIGYGEGQGAQCLIQAAREICPDAFLIGEHLPEEPKKTTTVDFDGVWHARASRALKALLGQREVDKYDWSEFVKPVRMFDPKPQGYPRPSWLVSYLVSHDEGRLAHELAEWGFTPERVQRKLMLGATFLLTAGGEPMFYQGEEWGEDTAFTRRANPIHWERLEAEEGAALFEHYRRLCALRREHPALRSENVRFLIADRQTKVAAFHRWTDDGDDIVVVANFGGEGQTVSVPFPRDGRWRDPFTGREIQSGSPVDLSLEADEGAVLLRVD